MVDERSESFDSDPESDETSVEVSREDEVLGALVESLMEDAALVHLSMEFRYGNCFSLMAVFSDGRGKRQWRKPWR